MATEQSVVAAQFAFEDAKADILELYNENQRLKNIARVIAYPRRGTPEESYSMIDLAKILQATYSAEQLWVDPINR
jgi:hypothetical protein